MAFVVPTKKIECRGSADSDHPIQDYAELIPTKKVLQPHGRLSKRERATGAPTDREDRSQQLPHFNQHVPTVTSPRWSCGERRYPLSTSSAAASTKTSGPASSPTYPAVTASGPS
jgi:hypothetical protein